MNPTSISLGLLIVLFLILLLRRRRSQSKPQITRFDQAQRMCPSCGLITARLKANCLECGKPFPAVVYSISKKR
jgi:hypothetical protein